MTTADQSTSGIDPAAAGPPRGGPTGQGGSRPELAKIVLAIVLAGIAVYLVATRYTGAAVNWYLGDLKTDPGDPEARAGIRGLGARALPYLEKELESANANDRVVAILALSEIEGAESERLLAGAVADADLIAAANALSACGQRRDALTAAALVAGARDPRRNVRIAARRSLQTRMGLSWWVFGAPGDGARPR